jgi:hypothetical protein
MSAASEAATVLVSGILGDAAYVVSLYTAASVVRKVHTSDHELWCTTSAPSPGPYHLTSVGSADSVIIPKFCRAKHAESVARPLTYHKQKG